MKSLELKIKLTGNEYKIVQLDESPNWPKDAVFVTKKKRRTKHNVNWTTEPDYNMTAKLMADKIKRIGHIRPNDVIYRVVKVSKDDYRKPVLSVPRHGRSFISGKELKSWIAQMDKEYPFGYTTTPKLDVLESTPILDALAEKGKLMLSEITEMTEVDDFDDE